MTVQPYVIIRDEPIATPTPLGPSPVRQRVEKNESEEEKGKAIEATPFVWRDPKTIPMRDRLYGDLLIRKFVTATVAPGGVGKSSLVTTETAAQATGKALLGVAPSKPLGVWLWNLEDPQEETERKLQAWRCITN